MKNHNQPVAVEGYPFIGLFAFVTLVLALLGWAFLTFLALCLTLFSVYFFRNPERVVPGDAEAVVAPADGKIVFVGKVNDERCFHGEAVKVSIFMSIFNVHVNRVPFSGKIVDMFYNKGQFLNASLDKASLDNEQGGIILEAANGKRLLFVQIAGLIARRIVTYPKVGDLLNKGERYGLIRFGSRVDVYFPADAEVIVRLGERTVAGETIIGYLR
ncbi:phosphatidylserine decarboxylase family protein [Trichloromonas sp.]|uniref:phosphatidylserine decarboxylase family protein n=1 Tax=Trichloromonas sp. TaxID=3069249 RepID=UPI002A3CF33C|nr:phosphatidylserine decarboxylase family protein [Trichloromonas sp.]